MNEHEGSTDSIAWILDVTEARQPLSDSSPVWIREATVSSGPPVAYPERHPYCEIGIITEGAGASLVGREEIVRRPGDFLLLGPGIPHWGRISKFPQSAVTVYFLPTVLMEAGTVEMGFRILKRFTATQTLKDRVVRPPKAVQQKWNAYIQEMRKEFCNQYFGREIRLRALLFELLVDLVRWEESRGLQIGAGGRVGDWDTVFKALHFLREHYADRLYAEDVAQAAGVSQSSLKRIMRETLNLSWIKYLQAYRIYRAAALIGEGRFNITESAMEVGFDSISHFNSTFRQFMGASPKSFLPKK